MGKVVGGIVGAAGSYLGAKKIADAQGKKGALEQAAGERAAGMASFKPVAMISTPFGGTTGTGGYTVSPEIAGLQGQLVDQLGISMGQAQRAAEMQPQYEQAAQGLFTMGQSAIPGATFDDTVTNILNKRFEARQPFEEEQIQQLARTGFGRGSAGLRVGGGNPMLDEYLAQRDERVFEDEQAAIQEAMQRIKFGQGLFGGAAQTQGLGYDLQTASLKPTLGYLQAATVAQEPARQSYTDSLQEAALRANTGFNAARSYMAGAIPSAASYGMQGNVRGAALSGLTESFGEGLSGMKFPTMNGSPNNTGLFNNYNQFLPDFTFGQG
jgi:hypothetical protein